MVRTEILPDIYLSCIQTDRFKTACLSVNLLTQLNRETAAANALIPQVLRRGSTAHPDMDSLSRALDELYGASIEPCVRKLGEIQSVGFFSYFVDDRALPEGSVLGGVVSLVCELLLHPMTRGGLFLPAYVDDERAKLLDRIRGRINDKRSYAMLRMLEHMCDMESYSVYSLGTEDEAESIGYVKLTKYYRELLASSPVELIYCGSAKPETVEKLLRDGLMNIPRGEPDLDMGTDIRMNSSGDGVRYITEEMNVSQGKLSVGFRLGSCMDEPDYAAIRVFNAVYGGCLTSKLFRNVRERLQLCYYAGSGTDVLKGVMFINSGVDPAQYDAALAEILAQLEAVRRGEISEEELKSAKKSVASGLNTISDSSMAMESYLLTRICGGADCEPEELAALTEEVTAEDVGGIARSVVCDTVFFLKDGGDSEDEPGEDEDGE